MEQIELSVSQRSIVGKQVKSLRRQGIVPAVLYGRHLDKPLLLQAEARTFRKVLAQAGTSQLIKLNIEGQPRPQVALAREVQYEPISRDLYHVDFMAVSMAEKIRLKVPVVVEGEAPVAARHEGIILQTTNEIEIECLPDDLIDAVRVDASELDQVGLELKVSDLVTSLSNIEVLTDPDEVIVYITPVREEIIEEEEVLAPEPEPDVEVIARGKAEIEE